MGSLLGLVVWSSILYDAGIKAFIVETFHVRYTVQKAGIKFKAELGKEGRKSVSGVAVQNMRPGNIVKGAILEG